jgi:hypothetical protein
LGDRESALHWIAKVETAHVCWFPWLREIVPVEQKNQKSQISPFFAHT